jgi:ligand-binding sensor domain-containing protein/signal transduction histidine kinase
MKPYLAFIFLLCCFWLLCLRSPAQQISFKRVTPPEGASWGGFITGITQDQQGYMWFTTHTGLYRYDGYQWVAYKNSPMQETSLASDRAECTYADRAGYIWVGTFGQGLERLDPQTGKFTHFIHNPDDKNSISSDTVTVLLEDREGMLWVGTHNGLNLYNPETGTFTHYVHNRNDTASLSNNQVRAIYEDRQGTIWVGTGSPFAGETPEGEGGLNKFDRLTGKFQRYLHDPENPRSLINNKVRAIFEDSRGTFWVGTFGDGLHTMDRKSGTFTRHKYDPAQPEKLSRPYLRSGRTDDGVTFIHEDASGAIWIGSYRGGLNRYDPETKRVQHFEYSKNVSHGIGDNGTWAAYSSREGVLWISTWGGDIYCVNPFRSIIPYVEMGASVNAFFEEPSGVLWLGTEHGVVRQDKLHQITTRFIRDATDSTSLSDNYILSVHQDRQGTIWIGTEKGGLNRFDRESETFTHYRHDPSDEGSIRSDGIVAIMEDRKGQLWLGTAKGLDRFDAKTASFIHYDEKVNGGKKQPEYIINCLLEDQEGDIWMGTYKGKHGVSRVSPATGKFKHYLEGTNINSLYEDKQGTLWAGTDVGLFQFNHAKGRFIPFVDPFTGKGFPLVTNVLEDNQQSLWVSTSAGLVRVNRSRDALSLYGWNHGVNPIAFTMGGHIGRSGALYIGDKNGYYSFMPEMIGVNVQPPQIILTDFRLFDKVVKPGSDKPFDVQLSEVKEIFLDHDENVFSFSFAGIHYRNPEENRHLYKLEKYDEVWRAASLDRTASYFKVPPGKYVFRLKVANSDGVWSERSVTIHVGSPWWSTWWAYGLYATLLLAVIWGFIEYRSRALKCENRLLEKKVAARTAEVMAQNEEIIRKNKKIRAHRDRVERTLWELQAAQSQLIQSEKMASLGELTAGIAHEIQNPLNFVNNFSEVSVELCTEIGQELEAGQLEAAHISLADLSHNLHKIQQHGRRAESIVKGMLQHSRSSSGQKEPTDLNALANEYMRLAYHGLRAKDKTFSAHLITNLDPQLEKVEVVPQEFGRVLLNLFNNAFYAVQQKQKQGLKDYEPEVRLTTRQQGGKVEVRVRDNGTGIPSKDRRKIFQPFFTTKPSGQGTGLGLSLSYDIITMGHGGELQVDSEEGEFTELVIQLSVSDLVEA